MYIFFIPFTHLISAIVLLIMWWADRERRYLLWWGAAFALTPFTIVLDELLATPRLNGSLPITLLSGVIFSALVYTLSRGAFEFRLNRHASKGPRLFAILVMALFMLWVAIGSIAIIHLYVTLVTTLAMTHVAWSLWSKSVLQRITASVFLARGFMMLGMTIVGLSVPATQPLMHEYGHLTLATATTLSMGLLLLICFLRSQQELNDHLAILSLSHGITTQLQDINSVRDLGERILPPFVAKHGWDDGLMLQLDNVGKNLTIVGAFGRNAAASELANAPLVSMEKSISGQSVTRQEIVIQHELNGAQVDASHLIEFFNYLPKTAVAIPLVSNGEASGAIVLVSATHRAISNQEMALFETISHAVGLSVANAKHVAELAFLAKYDGLTGLGNRRAYHDYVANLKAAKVIVMLLDMNHFKEVNDTFGHIIGDELLKQLANRLYQALPSSDTRAFRLSGDEFVVVVSQQTHLDGGLTFAKLLASLFEERFVIKDISLKAAASIGVVEAAANELDSHELLRCADIAMYQAKKGHETIAVYNKDTDNEVRTRVELLAGMAEALEQGQFEMYHQPLIDMLSGRCTAAESLVRWHHPTKGFLSAAIFMPYLEATDHIQPLTRQVIDLSLKDLQSWQQQGLDLKMSINLSARNLFDQQLPDYLIERTRNYQVDPERVHLEITESALMTDPEISQTILQRLVNFGFAIALDDFGTGYSSLAYLAKFPIDVLKVDQSFVRGIDSNQRNHSIVKATIELSHELNKLVAAEGIEYPAEAEILKRLNCDLGQGYLYAKPMPNAEFIEWLLTHNNQLQQEYSLAGN
ncbi:putative bifunctional diguanylate cyclase/phosphodiesterase [Halioxenophilus sp. WMMB6]|uniref:putative bifunctional diguanylate cyclase/phosphodiesterase n=1 Tax=Halioxenophilus sp. WMMB6 TaxID=3073815 RepID=UPI00295EFE20|nr:EAL domain-containing protein [Halioxenophilus sp. WMMB6]